MITAESLKELLHYDPETGIFTWLQDRNSTARKGRPAGGISSLGYVQIRVDGRQQKAHRLAWLYVTGEWPPEMIDHRDGNRSNNIFTNLRAVSRTVNGQNRRRAPSHNRLGVLGVRKDGNKFMARLRVNGKQVYLGSFDTPEAAYESYLTAKRQHHQGCTL